jgi:hypothetical protein
MARRTPRPAAARTVVLTPLRETCLECGHRLWVAYHHKRTLMTLQGLCRLVSVVRQCPNPACSHYHVRYHPEEAGRWALPHGEFGLDVIAQIGAWRFAEHRSVPEMHQRLLAIGVSVAEREVTNLLHRYEELVALHVMDRQRLQEKLRTQSHVVLAIDGLQPDVGHEVLWVVRDCVSGEILLARSLLSSTQGDLTTLLKDVQAILPVPVAGIISDGQETIRSAVGFVFPDSPHQLCQFHYLRDATQPLFEADRHAKTQLKKYVRGVRPLERALEGLTDAEAETVRDYCLAVRSALTADGRAPLEAAGLTLQSRLHQISDSIGRVAEKRGSRHR